MRAFITKRGKLYGIDSKDILSKKKDRATSIARALFSWWATDELGCILTEVADFLRINKSNVLRSAQRGSRIEREKGISISE